MSGDEKTRVMAPPDNVVVGTQLSGTYELDERIASGGMGEVYRGHNIQTHDLVAIKIVLPEFARDQTILGLFRKEASILNHLQHEAIVRYHVFAIDQAIGRPYLAMEYVDGVPLVSMFERGPMAPEDARKLLFRLASGLSAAHEAGIIHRDLSPDNIILPGGKVERAKIIDFGIAKSASVGGETLLGGAFAGKYNFVSPEQLGMFSGEVTEQSDMYSLGLVIAAALRGRTYNMTGSQVEVIEKRRVIPDMTGIDDLLRPVLEAMLQPDPASRPPSMADIAEWVRGLQTSRLSPASAVTIPPTGMRMPTQPPQPFPTTPPSAAVSSVAPAVVGGQPELLPDEWSVVSGRSAPGAQPAGLSPGGVVVEPFAGTPQVVLPGSQVADLTWPPAPPARRGRGVALAGGLVLLLVASGAGAYFGGYLDRFMPAKPDLYAGWPSREPLPDGWAKKAVIAPVPPIIPDAPPPDGTPPISDNPPPVDTPPPTIGVFAQQVEWLKHYSGGDCFFAMVTSASASATEIEGFGKDAAAFRDLLDAFNKEFSPATEPEIGVRLIRPSQCPITDFLRGVMNSKGETPDLTLAKYEMADRDPLSGQLQMLPDMQTYLLLIDHDGFVHNLDAILKRSGDKADFKITLGLDAETGAEKTAVPQVLLAIAASAPLEAAQFRVATAASELLPRILAEIKSKKIDSGASARYFRIKG